MKKLTSAAFAAALLASAASVQAADDKPFSGTYLGADVGYLDLEGLDGGISYEGFLGLRKQTNGGFVYGIEGTFGSADIELLDHVWSVNGVLGAVVGQEGRGLIFVSGGYAEAKASAFGVSVTGDAFRGDIGYEYAMGDNYSIRIKATTFEFDDYGASAGFLVRF